MGQKESDSKSAIDFFGSEILWMVVGPSSALAWVPPPVVDSDGGCLGLVSRHITS